MSDRSYIVLLRKNLRTRLWIGGLAVALFIATLLGARAVTAPSGAPSAISKIGYDFLPFYAAGQLVREGRPREMYDLNAMRVLEKDIARQNNLPLGDGFGPFWNPPFFALPFAPLSTLSFRGAMLTWLGINLIALAIATTLLCRVLSAAGADWKTWGLVPLLVVSSMPFLLAITHGQNTFCSLMLLTLVVLAWRARRAVLTGAMIGLMAYKPQLAALVGLIAFIDLGWRVALGALCSAGALILSAAAAMPGIFQTYRVALPQMLRFMQVEHVYMWDRHVTLKAFWRLLLQGFPAGETNLAVTLLTGACAGALLLALVFAALRCRRSIETSAPTRDRLITATVAAMPLVMPFYFDYDLLLLAIPAVLLSRELMALGDRVLPTLWCLLYLSLIINPDIADLTRVNVAVVFLTLIAIPLIARALRQERETPQLAIRPPVPLATAA